MRARLVILGTLIATLALACSSEDVNDGTAAFDPTAAPSEDIAAQVATGKADGISKDIAFGETKQGEVAGESIQLYSTQFAEGDHVQIEVKSLSADFKPGAYLYFGTRTFVAPDDYQVTADGVSLNYVTENKGEHFILVRAYEGAAGSYSLELKCNGGPCAGAPPPPDNPIDAANECLVGALRCAFEVLPSKNGYVGETTANNIIEDCLAEQTASLGWECGNACDGQLQTEFCTSLVQDLIVYADLDKACHDVAMGCLSDCEEFSGWYGDGDFEYTAAYSCWVEGHSGNCNDYASQHAACGVAGGYTEGSPDACFALCSSTEGAFDEGPWDSCTEVCEDLCIGPMGDCAVSCDADFETALGDDLDCLLTCLGDRSSTDCRYY